VYNWKDPMIKSDVKILLIDDFNATRTIFKLELARLGFRNITESEDGMDAYEKICLSHAAKIPFSLIISDWNMPNMTGIELLQQLRADERFLSLPFIIVTAEEEQTYAMQAMTSGATDFFVKPISPSMIAKKLEGSLGKLDD
jgi:two-component system chemotaxis response regulator CheY